MKNKVISETNAKDFSTQTVRRFLGLLAVAWVFLSGIIPSSAQGRPTPRQKKDHEAFVTAGRALYSDGKYPEAIEQFEKAYEIIPDSRLLFNLAQSHRLAGNAETALGFYRRFLEVIPEIRGLTAAKKSAVAEDVNKWIGELENELRLRKEKAEKAERERLEKERLERELRERELEKQRMEKERLEQELLSASKKPTITDLASQWWFWTGAGATVLFAIGTTWAGVQVLSYNADWKKDWRKSDRDKAHLYQDIADLSLAGAIGVGLAVTVYSYFFLQSGSTRVTGKATPLALFPGCDGTGCMLHLTLDF